MRMTAILLLALGALGQQASAQPMTPAQCRTMEPTLAQTAFSFRQQVNSYPALAQGMAIILQKDGGRPQLGAAAVQVAAQAARAMEAQQALLAALEDLQH